MRMENGGRAVGAAKETLATAAAIAACDGLDGVKDGVLRDPRACKYSSAALVAGGQLTKGEVREPAPSLLFGCGFLTDPSQNMCMYYVNVL